jgi:hypothetical protein
MFSKTTDKPICPEQQIQCKHCGRIMRVSELSKEYIGTHPDPGSYKGVWQLEYLYCRCSPMYPLVWGRNDGTMIIAQGGNMEPVYHPKP